MLAELLKECGAIKFGKFRLTSGKESNYYIDLKTAVLDPKILEKLVEELAKNLTGKEDKIACIELGAVPLATALSIKTKLPFVIMRKEKPTHGMQRQIIGEITKGENFVIVEDVATTGNSILRVVNAIKAHGGIISRALVVVDREEGAESLLKENSIELISLIKVSELK